MSQIPYINNRLIRIDIDRKSLEIFYNQGHISQNAFIDRMAELKVEEDALKEERDALEKLPNHRRHLIHIPGKNDKEFAQHISNRT